MQSYKKIMKYKAIINRNFRILSNLLCYYDFSTINPKRESGETLVNG